MFYAKGGNYQIDIIEHVAHVRVWRRPDVDSEQGARFAQEIIASFERLAKSSIARGLVLDMREAPLVAGPKTQTSIAAMISPWEAANKPFSVVASSALQVLQLRRLCILHGPRKARVFTDAVQAQQWAAAGET